MNATVNTATDALFCHVVLLKDTPELACGSGGKDSDSKFIRKVNSQIPHIRHVDAGHDEPIRIIPLSARRIRIRRIVMRQRIRTQIRRTRHIPSRLLAATQTAIIRMPYL
jgi:hypothetical protein